jgi:hypothetical protein
MGVCIFSGCPRKATDKISFVHEEEANSFENSEGLKVSDEGEIIVCPKHKCIVLYDYSGFLKLFEEID